MLINWLRPCYVAIYTLLVSFRGGFLQLTDTAKSEVSGSAAIRWPSLQHLCMVRFFGFGGFTYVKTPVYMCMRVCIAIRRRRKESGSAHGENLVARMHSSIKIYISGKKSYIRDCAFVWSAQQRCSGKYACKVMQCNDVHCHGVEQAHLQVFISLPTQPPISVKNRRAKRFATTNVFK